MLKSLIILMFCFVFTFSLSQETDQQKIERKIDALYKTKNIKEINKIISNNTYLNQIFVYNTIKKNIKIAEENQNGEDLRKTYIVFASYWARIGNNTNSYDYYLKSEELSRKNGDYKTAGMAMMGQAIFIQGEKAKMDKYNQAISMLEKAKDSLNLIRGYMNIGYYYTIKATSGESSPKDIAKYKSKAFTQFKKAEILNASFKDLQNSAVLKYRLALWENFEGKNQNAIKLLEESENIFKKINRAEWVVYCQLEEARIYKDEKNYTKSLEILRKAEETTIKSKLNLQSVYIYDLLKKVYEETGDYKKAYQYANLYNQANAKEQELNSEDKIKVLQLEQLSEKSKAQLDIYKVESKNYKIILFAGIFISVLIIALLFSLFQINKKRLIEIANDNIIAEINLKNKQLEVELVKEKMKFSQEHLIRFANQVKRIETFLEKIKSHMKTLQLEENIQAEFNRLRLSFSEIMDKQNNLKQIESLDSELNQHFFLYVKNHYDDITAGEEELLAYLVKDISSKEIAEILNITKESVNKKRYRLRKKLALTNEQSFLDFYKNIGSTKI